MTFTLTLLSDNIYLVDMFGNYLFNNSDYCFYNRTFNDNLPDTDIYVIVSDSLKKIEKVVKSLENKYIIVVSHRNDKFFYERLFSLGVNSIYDYTSDLKLFDDIGLQLFIYYNSLSNDELESIIASAMEVANTNN